MPGSAVDEKQVSATDLMDQFTRVLDERLEPLRPTADDGQGPAAEGQDGVVSVRLEQEPPPGAIVPMHWDGKVLEALDDAERAVQGLEAQMGQTFLGVIERPLNDATRALNAPVGSILVGSGFGLAAGGAADALASGADNPIPVRQLLKTGGAAAVMAPQLGGQIMSKNARLAASTILVAQALADFAWVDTAIANIESFFSGLLGGGGNDNDQSTSVQVQRAVAHRALPSGAESAQFGPSTRPGSAFEDVLRGAA